ncbi:MAG: DNA repair protein [Lachnospiraceae bacterium]|nr:DNA repair protein [Lachnospiraceae bacterium]
MKQRYYLCIDLKSFYASVECVERGLDPMTTKLVVADPDRSSNTICLAVSPALKRLGVRNRCRVGDIPKELHYIIAKPRMQRYIDYSARIYGIYLSYFSKEDIHVYSVDEAFMDVTDYLALYSMTPRELGRKIMDTVLEQTGIRATCGIGTNLYLTKIALDITAKHSPDFIGELDEESYRATLWDHKPLTDFWRIGHGTAARLAQYAIYTMRDIASTDEDFLYRLFGIDAELLIDHAWGREPVTIADIRNYHPRSKCLSNGQVLMSDYPFDKGRIIVKEMMDVLCLEMLSKDVVTPTVSLYIGYSGSDYLPRKIGNMPPVPAAFLSGAPHATGRVSLETPSSSSALWLPAISSLYDRIVDPERTIRRVNITCCDIAHEEFRQLDLFSDPAGSEKQKRVQEAILEIHARFGKDLMIRGMDLEDGAMTLERNHQIGGHRSGL